MQKFAWGFHTSTGGNKNGIGPFISRLNSAGIPVMVKATSDAGPCYEAQESGKKHGVDNLLVYRVTNNNTYQYDTPHYDLPPSEAADKHWKATVLVWPPELDRSIVWMEPINEPRAKLEPNETTPTWGGMHPVAWLGRFMVEYANIAKASGFKVCGPSFSSGDPDVDLWQLDGMADWLRYCADNPDTAALSVHEYNYGAVPYADNYPWHYGRFQAIIAAADKLGIPRTFRIFATEFGWQYESVPTWETAVPVLRKYAELGAMFPQLEGVALWTLQTGWGGISNQLAAWITNNGTDLSGDPFAQWAIDNQLETLEQPQTTAVEFGATLPSQAPPGGGEGGTVEIKIPNNHGGYITHLGPGDKVLTLRPGFFEGNTFVKNGSKIEIPLPDTVRALQYVSIGEKVIVVDCPENPSPPDPTPPPSTVFNPPNGATIVDLSYWNNVDLDDIKASGVAGVMIRTSNGIRKGSSSDPNDSTDESGVDKRFFAYAKKATEIGLPFGVTHFQNEAFDDVEQLEHFRAIVMTAVAMGYMPTYRIALNYEETSPATEARLIVAFTHLVTNKPVLLPVFAYSRQSWWNAIVPESATWPRDLGVESWQAAYPYSDPPTTYPPATWKPFVMNGFDKVSLWQWTSQGGLWVGHSIVNLDLNLVNAVLPSDGIPTPPGTKPPDPPTPPGKTYPTAFMRGEPGIWRVIRRADGSGEDVWELPLDAANDVRVKNANEGEWYEYRADGVYRLRDTSPAPDSQGNDRLYQLSINGALGGKIAPAVAEIGKTYSYTNEVQFKRKSDCVNLAENSGLGVSTFKLVAVVDNYTFNGTGFTVDKLYITEQTGETQLYCEHAGRVIGWCGGGASQANNVWSGELLEVYYDRQIPAQEPPRYCS